MPSTRVIVPIVGVVALRRRRPRVEVANHAWRRAVDILREKDEACLVFDERRAAMRADVVLDQRRTGCGIKAGRAAWKAPPRTAARAQPRGNSDGKAIALQARDQLGRAHGFSRAETRHNASASFWPADFFTPCPSTISCPHAARMSRPRLLRTDTISPRSTRIFANALTRSSLGRSKGMPGRRVQRQQVDLGLHARQHLHQPRASSGESFTPASITYSNMMRRRLASGNRLQAAIDVLRANTCGSSGTIAARCSVGGGVERHRQVRHQRLGGQPVHHRHQADGRQRHALRMHREALVPIEHPAAPSSSRRSCAAARPSPSGRC